MKPLLDDDTVLELIGALEGLVEAMRRRNGEALAASYDTAVRLLRRIEEME